MNRYLEETPSVLDGLEVGVVVKGVTSWYVDLKGKKIFFNLGHLFNPPKNSKLGVGKV